MSEDEFWRKTPRQVVRAFDAQNKILMREHNERAWLAWHIAALPRSKKLPKLEKMLLRTGKKTRQTWQEDLAAMDRWVAVTNRLEPKAKGK